MLANESTKDLCLRGEWQDFITSGKKPEHVNTYILDSWERSKEYGINPYDGRANIILAHNELINLLKKNDKLIRIVKSYTGKIYEIIQGLGYLIFFTDNEGNLIHIEGDKNVSEEFAEKICFKIGASWSEKSVGTTAVSMVLNLRSPVSFMSEEKFCIELKKRACSAVPIKDVNGDILGVLGIAANCPRANEEIFGMLIIAEMAIENHLRMINTAEEINLLGSYYKSILDSVSDGVITIDKRGILININKSAERILLINSKDAVGKPVSEVLEFGTKIVDMLKSGRNYQNDEFIVGYHKNGIKHSIKNSVHIIQRNGEVGGVIDVINKIKGDRHSIDKDTGETSKIMFENIIGRSMGIQEAKRQAYLAAASPVSVLITGETGTGKELFAQAMHNEGYRSEGPFIAINCGAIPRELIESELFGYEDGAFTGARNGGRPGHFELASGGTIFLDEIGEMPLDMQVKLLRVLQQKEVMRIGGVKSIPIDVKVISATNKDLVKEINNGRFRQDLYWRINVITINIPPLIQREGDIKLIADFFIEKYNEKYHKSFVLDKSTLKVLAEYNWPGNVREMENALLRAVTFAQGNVILPENLPQSILGKSAGINNKQTFSLADNEKYMIEKCLHESAGNIYKAAKALGISRNTLYCKLKKYNIEYIRQ
ncbi:MAG: sigma 54-interacting transcriptional regulator [Firmicutes bacterium]|nr:sigma 54-interacting transcriptional regulator [Bacillota bacterium]